MLPMQPCRFPPGEVPNCTNLREATGTVLYKGVVVRRTAAGLLEKHPLNVASGVLGVSQGGAALDETVNVAKADQVTEFLAHITDGTNAELQVDAVIPGARYGISEVPLGGYGALDTIATLRAVGAAPLAAVELAEVTDVKPELNVVIFKFLPAVMQEVAT